MRDFIDVCDQASGVKSPNFTAHLPESICDRPTPTQATLFSHWKQIPGKASATEQRQFLSRTFRWSSYVPVAELEFGGSSPSTALTQWIGLAVFVRDGENSDDGVAILP